MATKTTKAKRRIFRQFSPQDGDSGGLGWHHPQLNCRLAPPDVKRLVHKPNFGWLCRWRFKTSSYKEICKPLKEVGSQKFGCSAGRFSGRAAGGWKSLQKGLENTVIICGQILKCPADEVPSPTTMKAAFKVQFIYCQPS
jgi:hypothetical protein